MSCRGLLPTAHPAGSPAAARIAAACTALRAQCPPDASSPPGTLLRSVNCYSGSATPCYLVTWSDGARTQARWRLPVSAGRAPDHRMGLLQASAGLVRVIMGGSEFGKPRWWLPIRPPGGRSGFADEYGPDCGADLRPAWPKWSSTGPTVPQPARRWRRLARSSTASRCCRCSPTGWKLRRNGPGAERSSWPAAPGAD